MWDIPWYTNLVLHKKGLPDRFSATIRKAFFDFIDMGSNALNGVLLLMCAL
jgi:hypothetical protein